MLSSENPEVIDLIDTTAISSKKKRSRPKKKKAPAAAPGTSDPKNTPSVKIPSSKTEASSNWKLLLSQKSSSISTKKNQTRLPFYSRKDSGTNWKDRRRPMNPQSDVAQGSSSFTTADPKNVSEEGPTETRERAQGDVKSHGHGQYQKKPFQDDLPPLPLLTGLNALGLFDYTHYGHLRTTVLPEHKYLTETTPALAIDCEMVGVGAMKEDALARVSVVNEFGYCLYDKFVKPKAQVTDYRTEFSGVREEDLRKAEDFKKVLEEMAEVMKGHIIVGHSLKNDFDVLFLKHPKAKIRDTAMYYKKRFKKPRTPSLKGLVKDYLNVNIQKGEHSSITDAQATMKLYLFCREEWEDSMSQKYNLRPHRYWLAREYRKSAQALGLGNFGGNLKKK